MVCSPVRGDNPRALASGLSRMQADKLWCNNNFIPPSSVSTLLSMTYFTLMFLDGGGAMVLGKLPVPARPANLD